MASFSDLAPCYLPIQGRGVFLSMPRSFADGLDGELLLDVPLHHLSFKFRSLLMYFPILIYRYTLPSLSLTLLALMGPGGSSRIIPSPVLCC